MTGAANANFGTCGNDGGNIGGGNDGGKWELSIAAPIVVVGNPSVMVVVKNAVIAIVVAIPCIVIAIVIAVITSSVVVILVVRVIIPIRTSLTTVSVWFSTCEMKAY